MKPAEASARADKTGIASAVLCMVHCLAVPLLFLLRMSFAGRLGGLQLPTWWEQLDYAFLALSLWAVYHAAGHTRHRAIRALLWVFWAVLACSIVFKENLAWLAYVASLGLITAHLLNIRDLRRG